MMHAIYVSLGEYFTLLCCLEIGIVMLTSRRHILSPYCARQDVSSHHRVLGLLHVEHL